MQGVVARLAAFALVVVGSFGTAYGLGQKLPGNPESKPHTHGAAPADPVPAVYEVDGYVLVTEAERSTTSALALHVNDPNGQRVTEFTLAHGSKLHVVLIRPDLSGFQHVHPDIDGNGTFVVPIDEPGKWHVVIDTQPAGAAAPIVLATNVDDEVGVPEVELPGPDDSVTVGELGVRRDGFDFTVSAADGSGSAVDGLEPYLGQAAHLIAIRKGDLAYTHVHAMGATADTFSFHGSLPAGTYRLFLQFGYRGQVITVPFTVVQP